MGKSIPIGLTYREADGTFIEQKQVFGKIKSFRRGEWIMVELDNGETLETSSGSICHSARRSRRI